jgi:hypothetical protein
MAPKGIVAPLTNTSTEAAIRRGHVFSSIVRYNSVLMKMNKAVPRSFKDLVQAVKDNTPDAYEQLKFRLLASFGLSKWQLAGKVIDHQAAGDARPSDLLDSMLSLLPSWDAHSSLSSSTVVAISNSSRDNSRLPISGRRRSKSLDSSSGGRSSRVLGHNGRHRHFFSKTFSSSD